MSDHEDIPDYLELIGASLNLGRSKSVTHPAPYSSYDEALAYIKADKHVHGPTSAEQAPAAKKPPVVKRRKIQESAIEFIEKEKEIYEE